MAGLANLFQLISLDRCVPGSPRRHAALKTRGGRLRLPPRRRPIRGGVVCMAHPRRIARVSKQIEREISNMLLYDQALQKAVCPEKRLGFDSMESAIASVTEVQVTNDLQVAKVYVSVYSDSQGKKRAMEGLMRLQGYVRRSIGQRMRLRLTPDIRFVYDDTYERTARIDALLRRVELEKQGKVEPPPIALPGDDGCDSEAEEDDGERWAAEEELEEDGFLDELEDGNAAATSGISYTSKKEKARMLAGRSRARRRDGSGGKPSPGRR